MTLDTDDIIDWILREKPEFKNIENFRSKVHEATDEEADFINSRKGRVYWVKDAAEYVKGQLKEQTFDIKMLIRIFDLEFEYMQKFTNLVK